MTGATKAVQAKENKVEFGLRNCYYAVVTVDESGKITYGAPKKLPGAVSITFDKSGDLIRFKADDIDYYTNANNQGYEGTLTLARVPEEFRTEVLNLNYSWISIRPNNCTMSSKIDSGSSNYSEIICQKGIKSLWQFLEELFSCQGSLIVAIPAVHTVC